MGLFSAGPWKRVALLGVVERSQIDLFNCNVKSYSEMGMHPVPGKTELLSTTGVYWGPLGML